jgi:hypothetical protein
MRPLLVSTSEETYFDAWQQMNSPLPSCEILYNINMNEHHERKSTVLLFRAITKHTSRAHVRLSIWSVKINSDGGHDSIHSLQKHRIIGLFKGALG